MLLTPKKSWTGYALSVVAVALATCLALAVQHWTTGRVPFMPFFPALIFIAIYAGTGPALLAVALSTMIAPVLMHLGSSSPMISEASLIASTLYLIVSLCIVWICKSARTSKVIARTAQESSRAQELVTLAKAQELQTVMKAVPAAIFIAHDPKCEVITGSSFSYQLMEIPEGKNVSQTPRDGNPPKHYEIRHPDGKAFGPGEYPLQRAAKGEPQRQVRMDLHFENGKTRALFGNAEPLLDVDGKPRGAVGAFVDVTSVLEADRAVKVTGERFRIMADSAPVLAWITDASGKGVWFNKGWLDFSGRTMEVALLHDWAEGIHPDDQASCMRLFRDHFDRRESFSIEYRRMNNNGEYRWLLVRGLPLYEGADGAFSGFIGTCIDITDRRRSEEHEAALLDAERSARMESERVGRLKDEFLATLSHELRTPLSAILGWAQLLTHGETDPEQVKQGLEAISRNARAQTQMIEDLLDMSRIISGKIRLNVQRVDLAEVVGSAIESILPAANAKGVRVLKVLDPMAGPTAGDPGRLQQVVWNLLTNAIKFTPKDGKIEVLLRRVDSHVEISVTDNGLGIKPEFLPYVFERFRQDDGSTTRKHGGLGLGLSIVKQLVELHGGTVSASSVGEGAGTTFVVTLPLSPTRILADDDGRHPTASGPGTNYEPPKLTGVRVLIVDDDKDTRSLIERIFLNYGADVLVAASADEGLEHVKASLPQLIVSDIGMPVQDGYEFMRRVRALPGERGGTTPSMALTAFARSEDRQRALMAGYQMHMAKPVEPAELVIACASLVGRHTMGGV